MKKMHSAQAMWHAGFKAAVLIAAALPAFAVQALLMAPWVSCDTEENL